MSKELDLLKTIALMGVEKEYRELVLNSQEYLELKQALTRPLDSKLVGIINRLKGANWRNVGLPDL